MSDIKAFKIKRFYERDIAIRDDDTSETRVIPIRIRRLGVSEMGQFQEGFRRVVNPKSARFIYRKIDGDEQQMIGEGAAATFVISDDEVARRRVEEMSAERRAEFEQLQGDDNRHLDEFSARMIAAHVWVAPGFSLTVEDDNGEERAASSGEALAEVLAGNLSVRGALLGLIYSANSLTADQKKALRSQSALNGSSSTHVGGAAAAGVKPVPTAESAASADSVKSADVSVDLEQSPSGSSQAAG